MTKADISQLKKWVPQTKPKISQNEVSITHNKIYIPRENVAKLKAGEIIDIFYDSANRIIALKRSENGERTIREGNKSKGSIVNCKQLLDMLKVKKGRYETEYDKESGYFVIHLGD